MAKKILALIFAVLMLLSVCSCDLSGIYGGQHQQGGETDPDNKNEVAPSDTTPENTGNATPSETPSAGDTPEGNKPPEEPAVTTEREFSKLY